MNDEAPKKDVEDYSGYSQDERPIPKPLTEAEIAKAGILSQEEVAEKDRDYSGYSQDEKPIPKPLSAEKIAALGILSQAQVEERRRKARGDYDPDEGKLM
jgi:hypothetical protein